MNNLVEIGAKAPMSPVVCNQGYFLYEYMEPTLEMVDWYYRTSSTDIIYMREIDHYTLVVEITKLTENKRIHRSFTIGASTKELIYKSYAYYHRMGNGYDNKSVKRR